MANPWDNAPVVGPAPRKRPAVKANPWDAAPAVGAAPVAPAAAPSFAETATEEAVGPIKSLVHDPLGTIGGMAKSTIEGAAQPVTGLAEAAQTIMGASPANVLRNLPQVDTQALRDRGWDDARIEHLLNEHNRVANDLMADVDAESKKVTEKTANGIALYLSTLAGILTGGAAGPAAARMGAGPILTKAAGSILGGGAGLGTFSGAHSAAMGESPGTVAAKTVGGTLGGMALGALHAGGEVPVVKQGLAKAGESLGFGVSPEATLAPRPFTVEGNVVTGPRGERAVFESPAAAQEYVQRNGGGNVIETPPAGEWVPKGDGTVAGPGGKVLTFDSAQKAAEWADAKNAGRLPEPGMTRVDEGFAREATPAELMTGAEKAMLLSATPAERAAFLEARRSNTRRPAEGLASSAPKAGDTVSFEEGGKPQTGTIVRTSEGFGAEIELPDGKVTRVHPGRLTVVKPAEATPATARPDMGPAPSGMGPTTPSVPTPPPPVNEFEAMQARHADPLVKRITDALKAVPKGLKTQAEINSSERSARLGAAKAASKAAGGGEAGYRAGMGALKGPFARAEFEGIRDQFKQPEIDRLHNMIEETPLTGYEHFRAMGALNKLLGLKVEGKEGHVAGVPNASELALLRQVFGKDFVQAAMDKRGTMAKFGAQLGAVLNVPRTIMASFDLSAPGRQGFLLSTTPQFWKNLTPMVKAWGNEKFFESGQQEMMARPEYKQFKQAGGAFTDPHGEIGPLEETYAAKFLNKAPFIERSGRAHSFFLNRLRMDTFKRLLDEGEKAGIDIKKDHQFQSAAADYVNQATGRGDFKNFNERFNKGFEKSTGLLNAVLFSPRLLASRMETIRGLLDVTNVAKVHPLVRQQMYKNTLGAAAAATTAVGLASLIPGITVNTNPYNADFGKVRAGDTRFDMFGGHLQLIRFAAQITGGKTVSSTTGKERTVGDENARHPLTRFEILQKFVESKESPVAGFVFNLLKGTNFAGKPIDWKSEAVQRLIPLAVQDTYDAMQEYGPAGAAAFIPAAAGIGVQTYGSPVTRQSNVINSALEGIDTWGLPTIEFTGADGQQHRGIVPKEAAKQYVKELQGAEGEALKRLVAMPGFHAADPQKQDALRQKVVNAYRAKVRNRWVKANKDAIVKGAQSNKSVRLATPPSNPWDNAAAPEEVTNENP